MKNSLHQSQTFRARRFILLLALLGLGAVAPQIVDGIKNIRFRGDVVANTEAGKTVYIAVRTDNPPAVAGVCAGQGGSGREADPCDGSTQPKLDAIFKSHHDAGAQDVKFILAAGTYHLKGGWDDEWSLLHGWHIKGAGMNHTRIIQVVGHKGVLNDAPSGLFGRTGAMSLARDGNEVVEDLWLDLAWFREGPGGDNSRPNGNFMGATLYGPNCRIQNVKVTGAGCAVRENFPLLIAGGLYSTGASHETIPHNGALIGNHVSKCGQNVSAITLLNLSGQKTGDPGHKVPYARNGVIRGNYVDGANIGTGWGLGFDGSLVADNYIVNASIGIFDDTFSGRNCRVTRNYVHAAVGLAGFYGHQPNEHLDYRIDGNVFVIRRGSGENSAFNLSSYGIRQSVFEGNTIISEDPAKDQRWMVLSSDAPQIEEFVVRHNTIGPNLTYTTFTHTPGVVFEQNLKTDGELAIANTTSRPVATFSLRRQNESVAQVNAHDPARRSRLESK